MQQRSTAYLPSLDGLRAIAVALVLWAHTPESLTAIPGLQWLSTLKRIINPGYLGVDLFFVLSGFLITRILLATREKANPLRNFYIRRSLRIFPIYYLLILLCAVIAPGIYLLAAATYTSNYVFSFDASPNLLRHTWSLAVEEHFYLIWPLLVLKLTPALSKIIAWIGLALAIASVSLHFWFLAEGPAAELAYRASHCRFASLLMGALLSYGDFRRDRTGWIALLTIVAATAFGCLVSPTGWKATLKLSLFLGASTVALAMLIASEQKQGRLSKIIGQPWLIEIGKLSYGIYLYHYPIFSWLGLHDTEQATSIPVWLLAVFATIAVSFLSYILVESKFLKLKGKFA